MMDTEDFTKHWTLIAVFFIVGLACAGLLLAQGSHQAEPDPVAQMEQRVAELENTAKAHQRRLDVLMDRIDKIVVHSRDELAEIVVLSPVEWDGN